MLTDGAERLGAELGALLADFLVDEEPDPPAERSGIRSPADTLHSRGDLQPRRDVILSEAGSPSSRSTSRWWSVTTRTPLRSTTATPRERPPRPQSSSPIPPQPPRAARP